MKFQIAAVVLPAIDELTPERMQRNDSFLGDASCVTTAAKDSTAVRVVLWPAGSRQPPASCPQSEIGLELVVSHDGWRRRWSDANSSG